MEFATFSSQRRKRQSEYGPCVLFRATESLLRAARLTILVGEEAGLSNNLTAPTMESELNPNRAANAEPTDDGAPGDGSSYRISSRPLIHNGAGRGAALAADLPRSYGIQTLCLMARDPHSLFAYWDIDWSAAFHENPPLARKVHLRIRDESGAEQTSVEVEPMAGACYVTVSDSDRVYSGEIGYFNPSNVWNCLATSEVVTTPPDSLVESDEIDFVTVPFHLSFQHMIDALRISKQENESLTAMLRDLRERAAAADTNGTLTAEQRELARVLESAHSAAPKADSRSSDPASVWTQRRLERTPAFGPSSPEGGFGGSSRNA